MSSDTTSRPGFRFLSMALVLVFLGSVLRPDLILAQEKGPEAALVRAKHYYEVGKYQEALDELVPLISKGEEYEAHLMVEIYKYLAFCNAAYGKWEIVKKHFKRALEYNPDLMLDPVFTSPKIMEVFQEAKEEYSREVKEGEKAPQPGSLLVAANVIGAEVYFNGVRAGFTPEPFPRKVSAGRYKVEVKKTGYSTWEKTIEVRPGDKIALKADLIRVARAGKPWYKKAWFWSVVAVAVGGAATGVYLVGFRDDSGPAGDVTIYY